PRTPTTADHPRSLHDALPIYEQGREIYRASARIYDLQPEPDDNAVVMAQLAAATLSAVTREVVSSLSDWPDQRMNYESRRRRIPDRKSTRLNSSHVKISYAVF